MLKGHDGVETPEYQIHPSDLPDPWRSRRGSNGEAMYAALGIGREDKATRMAAVDRNFDFFGGSGRPVASYAALDGETAMGRSGHVAADPDAAAGRSRAWILRARSLVNLS